MADIRTIIDEDPRPRASSDTRQALTVALAKPGRGACWNHTRQRFIAAQRVRLPDPRISTMRISLGPIKTVILVILSLVALPLRAQTQPPTAFMTIQVQVPSNTPAGDTIWVFGGQFFNIFSPRVPMSRVPATSNTWQATISAPAGTIFRYYFARNSDYSKLESYAPFWPQGYSIGPGLYQQQSPLRELLVTNGTTIRETVAAWADTPPLQGSTGTIAGAITDKAGNPLTGLWISAGPHQTFSDADGNYQMQGVPAGPCTITVRSENGEYGAVNLSVNIAANGTTTQNITVTAQPMSSVTFNVTVPATTPAGAVPHLFGDTYRLGMVEIAAQSPDTTRYADMAPVAGQQWSYTAQLGNGTCVNYLYTLGDNIFNFENQQSVIVTRALCVNGPTTVNDTVAAWRSPTQVAVTLTATSPTGAEDTLYVAADTGFGSTSVKMWPTGPGTATYTLYVNRNTTLKYRYFRNTDLETGVEIIGKDSDPPPYRSVTVGSSDLTINDTIHAWRNQMLEPALTSATSGITGTVAPRAEPFQTGIFIVDYWRASWMPLVAPTMSRIKSINARWAMIAVPWIPTIVDPPQFEFAFDDFPPQDLIVNIRAAKAAGLHVALRLEVFPTPFSPTQGNASLDALFQQIHSFSLYSPISQSRKAWRCSSWKACPGTTATSGTLMGPPELTSTPNGRLLSRQFAPVDIPVS
ncbi:MAG: carboxypeptidase regulatory-like domain-containing protein [Acidobacteriia bacterium]|nr:carboxypeptidase regulatory-like domain-containing protein [Terriglobia bacterium]